MGGGVWGQKWSIFCSDVRDEIRVEAELVFPL